MSKTIQPPKDISLMSPSELEDWKTLLEETEELHRLDTFDKLETLRELLNSSQVEAMHFLKKQSRFGKQCPYYVKAKFLFNRDDRATILSLLEQLDSELRSEDD